MSTIELRSNDPAWPPHGVPDWPLLQNSRPPAPQCGLFWTAMTNASDAAVPHNDIVYPSIIPFVVIHLGCFAAIWTGITWPAVALCVGLYWLRMFAVTAGYHR